MNDVDEKVRVPMRLLFLITQGEQGGAQKHILDVATSFKKDVHEVYVATGAQMVARDKWLFERLADAGFPKSNMIVFPSLFREIRPLHDIRSFIDIFRFVRANAFHLVHVHSTKAGILGAIAATLAGAKTVYTVHGFIFQEPQSFLKRGFYIAAEYIASFFVDQYICVSEKDKMMGERYGIIRGTRGKVIYNGIDDQVEIEDREKSRHEILRRANITFYPSKVVGVVANLYRTKGIEYLIRAAALLHESDDTIAFVVFGEGALRNELEQEIKEKGLEEIFKLPGRVEDARMYLSGFDVVVLPSVKEGFPYVLLEAAVAHVPIIATRVGGVIEMSKMIPMELVDPARPDELAAKIREVLTKGIRQDGGSLNERFLLPHMIDEIRSTYEHVMELHSS